MTPRPSPADEPMVRGFQGVQRLPGFSGADVFLLSRRRGPWFVRKAARTPLGNMRLQRQAAKQIAFAERRMLPVRTPRVLDEGAIAERYYFDMELVRGRDGATFMREASHPELRAFAEHLCGYLRLAAASNPIEPTDPIDLRARLRSKLCDVRSRVDPRHFDLLDTLDRQLSAIAMPEILRPTLSHGDLTLENIMVDYDRTIWFFDLLDPPFQHYWCDISKLAQDIEGGWYLRRGPAIAHSVRVFLKNSIIRVAEDLSDSYSQLSYVLLSLDFARILPYAHQPADVALVRSRISHFMAGRLSELPRSRDR
jgi:aminoglycoside phosphotransferase